MPNTLVHYAVQGLASRPLSKAGDLRWILLGCVVPDLPWILQRVVRELGIVDPIDLRVYAIAQASLLVSLCLCLALAALARRPARAMAFLGSAVLLHLVLDALQTKWANGVHLLAPWSWELWNAGFFWPEHPLNVAMTLLGGAAAVLWIRREPRPHLVLSVGPARGFAVALGLFAYGLLPAAFADAVRASDSHGVATLTERGARPGKPIAFDRNRFEARGAGTGVLHTWSGEALRVVSGGPDRDTEISALGRFESRDAIALESFHAHPAGWREIPSIAGLALLLWLWWPASTRGAPGG